MRAQPAVRTQEVRAHATGNCSYMVTFVMSVKVAYTYVFGLNLSPGLTDNNYGCKC